MLANYTCKSRQQVWHRYLTLNQLSNTSLLWCILMILSQTPRVEVSRSLTGLQTGERECGSTAWSGLSP